jgi:hypothetical protein
MSTLLRLCAASFATSLGGRAHDWGRAAVEIRLEIGVAEEGGKVERKWKPWGEEKKIERGKRKKKRKKETERKKKRKEKKEDVICGLYLKNNNSFPFPLFFSFPFFLFSFLFFFPL